MKPKPEILINALMKGIPIPFQGNTLKMFQPGETIPMPQGDMESDLPWVGAEMQQGEKKVYVGFEPTITALLAEARKLDEETTIGIAASIVLREECKDRTKAGASRT